MSFRLPILSLTLAGVAPLASAAQETKVPRPLPLHVSQKVASPDATSARYDPIPAPRTAIGQETYGKPMPPNAARVFECSSISSVVGFDEPGDGRVWARGGDYKASFGPEGATFIPFLGSDAPRNFPVRFTLSAVRVAGRTLAIEREGLVERHDARVSIDRGSVDEVYDLSTSSLEQTIVVESLPERGALTVDVAFETELVASAVDGTIQFRNELGGVDYGRVTVLDARGARFETSAQIVDHALRIDVPADFVESATLPLRIDPYVLTSTVAAGALDEYYSDISYDVTNNTWCVAYEYAYSGSDHDVYTLTFDAAGVQVPFLVGYVDLTTDWWTLPKIANNNLADNYLVVANVYPAAGGNSYVRGRIVAAVSAFTGAQFTISGTETGLKYWVDVGGDPALAGPTYYCVVWQRNFSSTDTDIHGRLVGSDGSLIGPGTILIEDSSGTLDLFPRISKTDGNAPYSTQEWNLVWQRLDSSQNESDVYGAQIHWDGTITTPTFPISNYLNDEAAPVASSPLDRASGPRPWMAVFVMTIGTDQDLYTSVLLNGTPVLAQDLSALEGTNLTENQTQPEVDSDGERFVVGFSEVFGGNPLDVDTYVSAFEYLEGALSVAEGHVNYDYTGYASFFPRVASQRSSGGTRGRFGVTWTRPNGTTPNYDVYLGLYDAPAQGAYDTYCYSGSVGFACPCGNTGSLGAGCTNSYDANGAFLAGYGSHRISSDAFQLTASGMPPSATCLFFQGATKIGSSFGDGVRCVGGTIIRLGIKTAVAGAASYPVGADVPISLKGLIPADGAVRNYQVWYRDSAAFCTSSSFNLTGGLSLTWLP